MPLSVVIRRPILCPAGRCRARDRRPRYRPPSLAVEKAASLPERPNVARSARVVDIVSGPLQVRLAETDADIDAAQALRYRIFYDIMGARPVEGAELAAP